MQRFWIILFLLFSLNLSAKLKYTKKDFIAPLDIKMTLSGTFGELRDNHLHSGIDIKTGGKIGKKVYAIADGYVSRIKVSPTGFGKAIYIRHPDGYTSVYGHLNRFTREISHYTKNQQYARKSFAVDLYLKPDQIQVKQGEVIAFSGNSGGSSGPHLHFEIRESETEKPVNPLFFDLEIKDYIRPIITAIKVYPLSERALINGKNKSLVLNSIGWGENHRLKDDTEIQVSGEIGFGIQTYDLLNDAPNKNGVYSIRLFIDDVLTYEQEFKKFSFSEGRYVNSLIDYAYYVNHKKRFQRSIKDPGNKISVVQKALNEGRILFNDDTVHQLIYEIKDANGNVSKFKCKLKSSKVTKRIETKEKGPNWFDYAEENKIKQDDLSLDFKPNTFYKSFKFYLKVLKPTKTYYSRIIQVHNKFVPVHKRFRIGIKPINLPRKLQSKALIVCLNDEKEPSPQGGKYINGMIETEVMELGKYTIMVDTKAPQITALNIHNGKKITNYKRISFKVTDELSGIEKYEGKLNGEWVLMEFDPKTDRIFYLVDQRMKKGKNTISLSVEDERGNTSSFNATVVY